MKRRFRINNLCCSGCAAKIESTILDFPGVESVSINLEGGVLTIVDDGVLALDSIRKVTSSIEPDASVVSLDAKETDDHSRHDHGHGEGDRVKKEIISIAFAGAIFVFALVFGGKLQSVLRIPGAGDGFVEYLLYGAAYLIAAFPVLTATSRTLFTKNFLNEFFLMSFASLAAIVIGKTPEAISVMLFYRVGEMFQELAASKSRSSIKALVEQKPSTARVLRGGKTFETSPEKVRKGDLVVVRPGEKIPVDGVVREGLSRIDASSLTGESLPVSVSPGETVYGGTVSKDGLLTIEASGSFEDSSVARIMEMVESAVARKSPTERFITKFARYYTPAVVAIAAALAILPPLLSMGSFSQWLYRALVLLVVSCPCALVISIPLGYFGGIGAASRSGVLVKGGSVFDALKETDAIFFDKTGTLTKGVFAVRNAIPADGVSREDLGTAAVIAESLSNHPVARSVAAEFGELYPGGISVTGEEKAGRGVVAVYTPQKDGVFGNPAPAVRLLAGNEALMAENGVAAREASGEAGSVVHVARDGVYLGSITVSDTIRPDSKEAIREIRECGIEKIYMLSGDREAVASSVAGELGLSGYRAGLTPDEKVAALGELASNIERAAFVGDGVNDGPVLATAGISIAMGGLGSELAVEISDAVILDDSPKKVASLLRIARFTRKVVWQNIIAAMGIKALFIALGVIGVAGLWEAIFADVGVAILAVLNAARTVRA
ncbi:MAG: heavy metal translocating P-type ATPase [Synergistaceae bacterium]|jgi:Cd2+/Zn2+-exporting ATPase|nr:heavy metal translocating P-type ATPase [Synergistaceae bacterium]